MSDVLLAEGKMRPSTSPPISTYEIERLQFSFVSVRHSKQLLHLLEQPNHHRLPRPLLCLLEMAHFLPWKSFG